MTRPKKSTREEITKRIDTCYSLLLNGASPKEIVLYSIKTWGVTLAMGYRYIEEAKELIRTNRVIDREFELGRELLRRDSLYQKAIRKEDLRLALSVCDSRCELVGLFAPLPADGKDEIILEWEDAKENQGQGAEPLPPSEGDSEPPGTL